jgi:aspartate/tyrosine/aromatic aminotransferase
MAPSETYPALAEALESPRKRAKAEEIQAYRGSVSCFAALQPVEPDAIVQLREQFQADPCPAKISLGLGVYRTDDKKPYLLETVKKAEARVLEAQAAGRFSMDYLPEDGLPELVVGSAKMVFGDALDASGLVGGLRPFTLQTCGGTGALRIGFGLLRAAGRRTVLIPEQTWAAHRFILAAEGMDVRTYRYYERQANQLDIDGLLADLDAAPACSVVLLHASGHNPTGRDPSRDEWRAICDVVERRGHFAFFDMAYQGFTSGDFDADAWAVRNFASRGTLEMAVAHSFSKIMGIYCERVGTLSLLCSDPNKAASIRGRVKMLVRTQYSFPPAHGARVAATILGDPVLLADWRAEVDAMAARIRRVRTRLRDELIAINCPLPMRAPSPNHVADVPAVTDAAAITAAPTRASAWSHLVEQAGMFSFAGLTVDQIQRLRSEVRGRPRSTPGTPAHIVRQWRHCRWPKWHGRGHEASAHQREEHCSTGTVHDKLLGTLLFPYPHACCLRSNKPSCSPPPPLVPIAPHLHHLGWAHLHGGPLELRMRSSGGRDEASHRGVRVRSQSLVSVLGLQ